MLHGQIAMKDPPGVEAAATKTDFGWVADNRARIVAQWTRRSYGGAEEPAA